MTRLVNLRREPYDVYIGRAGHGEDGYFGNPCIKGETCVRCGAVHATGAETIPCFRDYFLERLAKDAEFRVRVKALKGCVIGCFCLPNPCHGQVYIEFLNRDDETIERELDWLIERASTWT